MDEKTLIGLLAGICAVLGLALVVLGVAITRRRSRNRYAKGLDPVADAISDAKAARYIQLEDGRGSVDGSGPEKTGWFGRKSKATTPHGQGKDATQMGTSKGYFDISSGNTTRASLHPEKALPPPIPGTTAVATPGGQQGHLTEQLSNFLEDQEGLPSYHVVKAYEPRKRDDMRLRVDDMVTISMTFTDGWCHGYNHTQKTMGMFPISAVAVLDRKNRSQKPAPARFNSGEPSPPPDSVAPFAPPPSRNNTETKRPEQKKSGNGGGKLIFSIVPPEQAIEIVAESLTAERRAHYFETLLRDAKKSNSITSTSPTSPHSPNDSTSSNPLEAQLRASMEGASGEESRAKQAWRKLRVNWKDAVREQLQDGYSAWLDRRNQFDIWGFMADSYRLEPGMSGSGWGMSEADTMSERGSVEFIHSP
ncbi:hypothetical protein DFS34DRAFT_620142 [Phlyctochytrium arcticum]|nr:hypothetical protein DFS34DRAFT_620142 [Phlyctochytrium arcticum]